MQRQLFGAAALVLLAVVCGSFVNEAAAASTVAPGGQEPDPDNPGKFRKCLIGTIKRYRGNSKCTPCIEKTGDGTMPYMPYTGRKGCFNCGPGGKVDKIMNGGYTVCTVGPGWEPKQRKSPRPCSPGTFKATAGNRKCSKCPAMSFQDKSGQTMCKFCSNPNPKRTACGKDCGTCTAANIYKGCNSNPNCRNYPLANGSDCACTTTRRCSTATKCSATTPCTGGLKCVSTCCGMICQADCPAAMMNGRMASAEPMEREAGVKYADTVPT